MEKTKLSRFISKYNLAGTVESVKWTSGGNKLATNFISDDKSLLGSVSMTDFEYGDAEFGIFDTSRLVKMMSVLGTDVEFDVNKVNDKSVSMKFKDGSTSMTYMLSDLSVITDAPALKNVPEFEAEIKLDMNTINSYIKGKSALAEEERFTFLCKGGKMQLVLGYSSINTNRITLDVEGTCSGDVDPIAFSADYLKEILVANKEAGEGVLKISSQGLAHVQFKVDEYVSDYYLVSRA